MRKLVLIGALASATAVLAATIPQAALAWCYGGYGYAYAHPPTGSPIRHGDTVLPTTPITPGGVGAGGDIEAGAGAGGTGAGGVGRQLWPGDLAH
jgi:hypothetical protein